MTRFEPSRCCWPSFSPGSREPRSRGRVRRGSGSATDVGGETASGELEHDLVRDVYRRAGVAIEDLPRGAYLEWRDGLRVGVNYGSDPVPFPVPSRAPVLLGTSPLPPAQVLVWKE